MRRGRAVRSAASATAILIDGGAWPALGADEHLTAPRRVVLVPFFRAREPVTAHKAVEGHHFFFSPVARTPYAGTLESQAPALLLVPSMDSRISAAYSRAHVLTEKSGRRFAAELDFRASEPLSAICMPTFRRRFAPSVVHHRHLRGSENR